MSGHVQACAVRHLRPWHTHASQKSQMAPCAQVHAKVYKNIIFVTIIIPRNKSSTLGRP